MIKLTLLLLRYFYGFGWIYRWVFNKIFSHIRIFIIATQISCYVAYSNYHRSIPNNIRAAICNEKKNEVKLFSALGALQSVRFVMSRRFFVLIYTNYCFILRNKLLLITHHKQPTSIVHAYGET